MSSRKICFLIWVNINLYQQPENSALKWITHMQNNLKYKINKQKTSFFEKHCIYAVGEEARFYFEYCKSHLNSDKFF